MPDNSSTAKKTISPDWFVQGILTKIGDTFDRLTGRGWKPSSSLATSELIERLKALLDAEVKMADDGRKYVPHNIKLKIQWDKFSTDSEASLRTLETEFLTAVVDHINDKHYYTYAPLSIEVKPDYFTAGVKLFVGFEKFVDDENEAEIDVSIPGEASARETIQAASPDEPPQFEISAAFEINGKPIVRTHAIAAGSRLTVGRTKENDIAIDDVSVSKFHAAIMLNDDGALQVADTGSTNGTFVNGRRISYGTSVIVNTGETVKFGTIAVSFGATRQTPELEPEIETEVPHSTTVGEFEFKTRTETVAALPVPPAVTISSAEPDWAMTDPQIEVERPDQTGSKP